MMAVVLNTWREIYRKWVIVSAALLTVLFLALVALGLSYLAHHATGLTSQNPLERYLQGASIFTLALYFANFTVAYLAIFSSIATISTEIENGLLLAILPRPIRRWQIYLGKWLAYVVCNLVYGGFLFWSLAFIVHLELGFHLDFLALTKAFAVFELIPLVLVTLSMLGSCFFPTLGNGIFMTMLFSLGLFGDFLERAGVIGSSSNLNELGLGVSLVMPTDALFQRVTFELFGGSSLPIGQDSLSFMGTFLTNANLPSIAFVIYAMVYVLVLLIIGMGLFTRRDV